MFTAVTRTTLLAAIAFTATIGTASADSRIAAPQTGEIVVKGIAPCRMPPCSTHNGFPKPFDRHNTIAAPAGTGGTGEPAAAIRWPWQKKKKNVDRTKF